MFNKLALVFLVLISNVYSLNINNNNNKTTAIIISKFDTFQLINTSNSTNSEQLITFLNNIENDETIENITLKNCLLLKIKEVKSFINSPVFKPGMIYDMRSLFLDHVRQCLTNDGIIFSNIIINQTQQSKSKELPLSKTKNWWYAFISAIIITIIGLLCYLVVPSLNACCFNYLFQFLVALAVGSLCGDALLHLIPHAFSEHHHDEDEHGDEDHSDHINDLESHNLGVYKGLAAVIGIYVFFIIEKIMHMRRARKEKRHKQTELAISESEHDLIRNTAKSNSTMILSQTAKLDHEVAVIDSNGNMLNEMRMNSSSILNTNNPNNNNNNNIIINTNNSNNKVYVNEQQNDNLNEDQSCLVIHANKDLKYISQYLPNNKCTENVDHHDHENEIEHLHQHSQVHRLGQLNSNKLIGEQSTLLTHAGDNPCVCTTPQTDDSANQSVSKENGKKNAHGHSHHSHHNYKSSREKAHHDHHKKHEKEISDIKLIAWMVLMGDGLHNFADGLAIGASFAASLSTGFGTAIAVLCHELPHEIGDFAVLRRAGVSLKRALVFNVVSGILCLLGVLIGLLIGSNDSLKNWAFLFIAGTFLYISLVDMIPELSEDKEDDSVINFLIQSIGILVGVGVMLLIALFEEQIKNSIKKKK